MYQFYATHPGGRRPSRTEDRPHTVHTSARTFDHQLPPEHGISAVFRAAAYTSSEHRPSNPFASFNSFRRPSEVSAAPAVDTDSDLPCLITYPQPTGSEGRMTRQRSMHRLRNPFKSFSGSFSNSNPPTNASQDTLVVPQEPARESTNLTNTLSRRLKSSIKVMGATTLPTAGRYRRASTPHNMGANSTSTTHLPPPPASPSKRNGKHGDDRPRKMRLGFADRKDTPAPASALAGPSSAAWRPASRSNSVPQSPVIITTGGEGARAAARGYNVTQLPLPSGPLTLRFSDMPSDQDGDEAAEIQRHTAINRARIGSLSSAADSGADLSAYSGSSCNDEKCGVDDESFVVVMDLDEQQQKQKENHLDFARFLPDEINLQIFEKLDANDLNNAATLSKRWMMLARETCVWRAAYVRRFARSIYTNPPPIQVGGIGVGRPNKPDQDWRRMYEARLKIEANWRKGAKDAGKAVYLSGHTDSVYCLQFDEEKIITGSRDRTIRVWDINTFQCLKVIGGPNVRPVLGPKVLRTVDYPSFHMATASVNGTNYGNQIYHVPSQWHDASILCLQYDDEILVTGSSDSDLLVWDVKTFEPIKRLRKHSGGVLDVALDAKHIVSCSKDSKIIVWDRQTLQPKGVLAGHRGPVNAVQLRGHLLVSASGDGIARLWDLNTMKLTKEFSAKERGLAAVEFSEDMKHVLAGGNDHITYKFETETGREVQQFVGHTQLVRSLWLDSANKRVVSGSYDLDLRVYDFETGDEIWRAEEWTTSWMLAAKSDYRRIVATSQDGRILIVDFGLQRGGREDGQPIPNVNLLRGIEKTNEIEWRDPFASSSR